MRESALKLFVFIGPNSGPFGTRILAIVARDEANAREIFKENVQNMWKEAGKDVETLEFYTARMLREQRHISAVRCAEGSFVEIVAPRQDLAFIPSPAAGFTGINQERTLKRK